MKTPLLLCLATSLAACSQPLPVANNVSAVEVNGVEEVMPSEGGANVGDADAEPVRTTGSFVEQDFLGRWVGVEGMTLDVVKAKTLGRYTLTMRWSLDDHGTFDGEPQSDPMAPGIAFRRNAEYLTLVHVDGAAIGMKYLAGKKNCLAVRSNAGLKPGEGYCRG